MGRTFAIGDVQGCLEPLERLLSKIHYDPEHDQLWFTGDLVNRGPQSLKTLRFIKSLPANTVCVLGNHDLALLAADQGVSVSLKNTFLEVLQAPDKVALLDWLKNRPVLHHDPHLGFTLTHAGIFPSWDLKVAQALAQELEAILRGSDAHLFFHNMYGNEPALWDDQLTGWERLRFITNAFTRMRFCTPTGALDFTAAGAPSHHPELVPWFAFPTRRTVHDKLIFGHWAALAGLVEAGELINPTVFALDTGCVWGNCLTAFCLQTQERVTVGC